MKKAQIEALAREAAKSIKTGKGLNDFSRMPKKITVETALNAGMDAHLGYDKHHYSDNSNSRAVKIRQDKHVTNKSVYLARRQLGRA